VIVAALMCSGMRVGRTPIMMMCAPMAWARASASFRLSRISFSSTCGASPASVVGRTLISMLNWPISACHTSLAMAWSTSSLRMAGPCSASTRLNSISMPVRGRSKSNRDSPSIRPKTSRQRRSFSR
jgi:hypothetical protein